jgi:hypothetical protein
MLKAIVKIFYFEDADFEKSMHYSSLNVGYVIQPYHKSLYYFLI